MTICTLNAYDASNRTASHSSTIHRDSLRAEWYALDMNFSNSCHAMSKIECGRNASILSFHLPRIEIHFENESNLCKFCGANAFERKILERWKSREVSTWRKTLSRTIEGEKFSDKKTRKNGTTIWYDICVEKDFILVSKFSFYYINYFFLIPI